MSAQLIILYCNINSIYYI